MSNQFDYELRANDQITGAIQRIDQAVTNLQPKLQKTADGLKLGGSETKDGVDDLSKKFTALARGAQQNVQYIGDMVPPLRNVTSFAGGVAGTAAKLGAIGAAGYVAVKGIEAAGSALAGIAGNALQIDISAKNADMAVNDFTRLTGAFRLLGISSESAGQSIQSVYKTFNDAVHARNPAVTALMAQLNVKIATKENGNADVTKTLQNLAELFPSMPAGFQKTVTDTLGLDANTLMLMRDGVHYKELLAKADQVGLTINQDTTDKLVQFNRQLNEISAAWDGLIQRSQQQIAMNIVESPSMQRVMGDVENNLNNNFDDPSFLRMVHIRTPEEESHIRRALKTPEFWKTLTEHEQWWAKHGIFVGDFEDKYGAFFKDKPEQDNSDNLKMHMREWHEPTSVNSSGSVNANALSVRNNNPWNLRYVGQPGAVPGYGGFAQFASKDAGVLAANRQLMLYVTGKSKNVGHPINTVQDIVSVASPVWENHTPDMIQKISAELGVNPNQPLDLVHDKALRSRFLTATFNQEGNNSYTSDQVQTLIASEDQPSPSPLRPPARPSLYAQNSDATVAAGANQQLSATELTNAFAAALKEQGMKIELTVINAETGQRQTISGTGGRVAASMVY